MTVMFEQSRLVLPWTPFGSQVAELAARRASGNPVVPADPGDECDCEACR